MQICPTTQILGLHSQQWQCDWYPLELSNGVALFSNCSQGFPQIMHSLPGQQHPFPHLLPQPPNNPPHIHTWLPNLYLNLSFLLMTSPPCPNVCLLHGDSAYAYSGLPHSTHFLTKPASLPCHVRLLHFPHLGHSKSCQGFFYILAHNYRLTFHS